MLIIAFASCKKDVAYYNETGYPNSINTIIMTKCAVSGCHNDKSYKAAGGLNLSSWTTLFEGGSGGAVVIPYRADQSWLQYFINFDSTKGICLKPTMPFNPQNANESNHLSQSQVDLISDWINNGAPNYIGEIPFPENTPRSKFYVANQGCDMLSVFDTKTKLCMRMIDMGAQAGIESPHDIEISPDGNYLYSVFQSGSVIQKFRTADDELVGTLSIGAGSWSSLVISPDGKTGFAADWNGNGKLAYINLENMQLIMYYQGTGLLQYPHIIAATSDWKTLYVTSQYGNNIYKIDITDPLNPSISDLTLGTGLPSVHVHDNTTLDPHDVVISPDGSKYFVTCQNKNEVRVFQTSNDSLIQIIPVGVYPQEQDFSLSYPYLFVTCTEDPNTNPLERGSVYVINYQTMQTIKILNNHFFQPHGLAVDDNAGILLVASRNVSAAGPAPHHTSVCGGRNGFLRAVNLSTLEFEENFHTEVSVDPYSIVIKK